MVGTAQLQKIVSRKPTEEMYTAGMRYLNNKGTAWCANDLFSAMHDAAPNNHKGCRGIEVAHNNFSGCIGMPDCPICEGA